MQLTSSQSKAARAFLGISAEGLAKLAGVSTETIWLFETNKTRPSKRTMEKIINAFDAQGIELIGTRGVARREDSIRIFEGSDQFHEFTEFVYSYVVQHGGDVRINAVDERLFKQYRRDLHLYRKRMNELVSSGRTRVRIIAAESEFKSEFAVYRKQPRKGLAPTAFYAFGDCLALISFSHPNPPYIVLHKSTPFAKSYSAIFDEAWENAELPD